MNTQIKMPGSQIAYGDTVYWLVVVSALLCMIGPFVALLDVGNNVGNPHYLYAAIFQGMDADQVWQKVAGGFPGGHFWMDSLSMGDGIAQLGLCLGGFVAAPSLVVASGFFIKEKQPLWVVLSLWVTFMIVVSAFGLISMEH